MYVSEYRWIKCEHSDIIVIDVTQQSTTLRYGIELNNIFSIIFLLLFYDKSMELNDYLCHVNIFSENPIYSNEFLCC